MTESEKQEYMKKHIDGLGYMDSQLIKNKLHYFNLTYDWSIFNDVPPIQQVNCMYPEETFLVGTTEEDKKKQLIGSFGELDNYHAELLKRFTEFKAKHQKSLIN